jgi:hypothetical protein
LGDGTTTDRNSPRRTSRLNVNIVSAKENLLLIAVVAIVLLLAGGAAYFLYLRPR